MLKTVSQKLNEILDLSDMPDEPIAPAKTTEVVCSGNPDKDMQDDFSVVRVGMRGLIEKTTELVDNANFFAKEKQDARSVEAASMATTPVMGAGQADQTLFGQTAMTTAP